MEFNYTAKGMKAFDTESGVLDTQNDLQEVTNALELYKKTPHLHTVGKIYLTKKICGGAIKVLRDNGFKVSTEDGGGHSQSSPSTTITW